MKPGSSKSKSDGRLNTIIVILLVQTILISILLVDNFDLLPAEKPVEQAFVEYPVEEQVQVVAEFPVEEQISPAQVENPIRIEILNGCKISGLAGKTADFLRGKGYDVRDFRNAPRVVQKTTILVRGSDMEMGKKLASAIALPEEMVIMEKDPELVDVDVSLVLGKDYKRYILPQ